MRNPHHSLVILATVLLHCNTAFFTISASAQEGSRPTITEQKTQPESADEELAHKAQQPDSVVTKSIDKEKLRLLPFRKIHGISMTQAGVWYLNYDRLFVDGLQASGHYYLIEGMQVADANHFPFRAVDGYHLHRTAAPAFSNNINGSLIELKTPDYGRHLHIEIDGHTSVHRNYQSNLIELNAGVPLRFGKNNSGSNPARLIIASAFSYTDDPHRGWQEKYSLSPSKLLDITNNPLDEMPPGTFYRSNILDRNDLESLYTYQHANRTSLNNFIKLIIPVHKNIDLSMGSYSRYDKGREFIFENAMMNSHNNPISTYQNFDNFLNYKHKIIDNEHLNIAYSLNLQYSNYRFRSEHENFGADYFHYGYIGSFTRNMVPAYEPGSVGDYEGLIMNAFSDQFLQFAPAEFNPELSNYTQHYYQLREGNVRRFEDLVWTQGGLLNGQNPSKVYGLWNNPGTVFPHFSLSEKEKYRGVFQLDINYRHHAFYAGIGYINEIERQYSLNTLALWSIMRGLTNFHIEQLDRDNPVPVYHNGVYGDTVNFFRLYDPLRQNDFDKNLRQKLGLPVDGLDYILIDSYDMANNTISYYDRNNVLHTIALSPGLLTLDMFSPEELLNLGNPIAFYMGYDHTGQRLSGKNNDYAFYDDFSINAYRPKSFSIFFGDRVKWKNLDISAGLHIDRFDANQPVLKDKYSLYEIKTSSEVTELAGMDVVHPQNIGNNYLVYVDNFQNPSSIAGYRDGSKWFDHTGKTVEGLPAYVMPLLRYPGKYIETGEWNPEISFKSYKPVISLLPRINLNLYTPVANFYAFYNSFSRSPEPYNYFLPWQYLYFGAPFVKTNPDLKPAIISKTGAGFKTSVTQWLVADMGYTGTYLKNHFYMDFILGAFPNSYFTYDNYDQTIPVHNLNLALHFVTGKSTGLETGIHFTRSFVDDKYQAFVNIPEMVVNSFATWQTGQGDDFIFDGSPVLKKVLGGVGIGMHFHYRNGLRLNKPERDEQKYFRTPPIRKLNARIEKAIYVKPLKLNTSFYLLVDNLFNARNVFYIHPVTGKTDDDGFLNNPAQQYFINSQLSPETYRTLYQNHQRNPDYYDKARTFYAGISIRF